MTVFPHNLNELPEDAQPVRGGHNLLPEEVVEHEKARRKSFFSRLFRRSAVDKYPAGSLESLTLCAAQLRNPVVKDIADIQPWLYYDRLTSAASAAPSASLLFFTTPMSSTKTKLDTNLKQAGRLPDPKHFLVMSLRFIFLNMFVPDITTMVANYYIEFEIGDKIYAEGHFDTYPGGAGTYASISSALTSPAAAAVASNGYPNPYAVNNWGKEHGIHILQGQTFQVRAISPAPPPLLANSAAVGGWTQQGNGSNIRALLDGILYREVQ